MSANLQPKPNQQPAPTALTRKEVEFPAFGSNERVKLSIEIVRNWIAKPTRSGKLASDGDVMRFIMLCKARQLNPWEGDAFLVGYDGKNGAEFSLITAHQAFLKRAEAHGQFNGMRSGVIVTNPDGGLLDLEGDFVPNGHKLEGAWCEVYRKDHAFPRKARLNFSTFNKGFSQWLANPMGMIVKCAEADALRQSFPNTLGGMYNEAEMRPEISEAPPAPDRITEGQRKEIIDAVKSVRMDNPALMSLLAEFGCKVVADVNTLQFEDVLSAVKNFGAIDVTPETDKEASGGQDSPNSGNENETASPKSEDDKEAEGLRASIRAFVNSVGVDKLSPGQQERFSKVDELTAEQLQRLYSEVEKKA